MQMSGLSTVVLDANIRIIASIRRFGAKRYLAEPIRSELLEAACLFNVSVLVVAVPPG